MCGLPSTPPATLPSDAGAPVFHIVWTRTERGNIALTIYASEDAALAMLDAIAEGAPVVLQQSDAPPYDNENRDALRKVVAEVSELVGAISHHPALDALYRCAHGNPISEPCEKCENDLPF